VRLQGGRPDCALPRIALRWPSPPATAELKGCGALLVGGSSANSQQRPAFARLELVDVVGPLAAAVRRAAWDAPATVCPRRARRRVKRSSPALLSRAPAGIRSGVQAGWLRPHAVAVAHLTADPARARSRTRATAITPDLGHAAGHIGRRLWMEQARAVGPAASGMEDCGRRGFRHEDGRRLPVRRSIRHNSRHRLRRHHDPRPPGRWGHAWTSGTVAWRSWAA
jgi:hypothetical protein